MPLDPCVLDVIIVRPDGNVQVKRKCQYVDVVGITLADLPSGLREHALVLRLFHHSDVESGAGQEQRVEFEPLIPGERWEVLEYLVVTCWLRTSRASSSARGYIGRSRLGRRIARLQRDWLRASFRCPRDGGR